MTDLRKPTDRPRRRPARIIVAAVAVALVLVVVGFWVATRSSRRPVRPVPAPATAPDCTTPPPGAYWCPATTAPTATTPPGSTR